MLLYLIVYLFVLAFFLFIALAISPFVVAGYALRQIWGCGRSYLTSFAQVLGIPEAGTAVKPPPPPRQRTDDGREPAFENYLFGQVRRDMIEALSRTWARARAETAADGRRIRYRWLAGSWTSEDLGSRLFGVLLLIGLAAGTLAGGFLLGVVALAQAILVVLFAGLGIVLILLLRVADSALLRVRSIRITCTQCYRHVPYPSYRCPSCGTLHRDVRPGRYGVLRRRCGEPAHAAHPGQPPARRLLPVRELRQAARREDGHRGRNHAGVVRGFERGQDPAARRHGDGASGADDARDDRRFRGPADRTAVGRAPAGAARQPASTADRAGQATGLLALPPAGRRAPSAGPFLRHGRGTVLRPRAAGRAGVLPVGANAHLRHRPVIHRRGVERAAAGPASGVLAAPRSFALVHIPATGSRGPGDAGGREAGQAGRGDQQGGCARPG